MNKRIAIKRASERVSPVLLAAITASLVFVPIVSGTGLSKEAKLCGGEKNTVLTEFDLHQANAIWSVFPAMLRAPELEDDTSPAHVVVFDGNVDLTGLIAAPGAVAPVADAVCVVQSDGVVNMYDNVSKNGAKYP